VVVPASWHAARHPGPNTARGDVLWGQALSWEIEISEQECPHSLHIEPKLFIKLCI
jgi:hypothetical protein